MNILIFSWRGPGHPDAGGAEISTYKHAKGWIKAGHSVTLFTSYYQGAKQKENLDGIMIIRDGSQILGVQLKAFLWYLFDNHPKFDLVVDEFHGIPFFTPFYVKARKLAFIHEVAKEVWKLNPWSWPFNIIPAKIGFILEPIIFRFYRNILFMTVSESTKKDLITFGVSGKNVTVVHNGFNALIKKNYPKEKKKTLIFLGALTKDKGIEKALMIFSILGRKEDFQFWVVGKSDPKYLQNLKKLSEKLKIDKEIKFWGFLTEEKKFELLERAHILINTSIREGWGLVVIEAASVGTPTIAFDVPGLRDSIIDNKTGFLCKGFNEDVLTDKIVTLLDDKKRYNRIRLGAMTWSKKFSWGEASNKSAELINRILS